MKAWNLSKSIGTRQGLSTAAALLLVMPFAAPGGELALVRGVDWQPLAAQVRRVVEAMDYLGVPVSAADRTALNQLTERDGGEEAVTRMQQVLDRYCLVGVQINPESRVKVAQGPAAAELVQHGWRQFLVKVHNEAGVTAELRGVSPNAMAVHNANAARTASDEEYRRRGAPPLKMPAADLWLDLQMFNAQPLQRQLSGLALEYRIIQLYSRDAGRREAKLAFNVGQGTQDIGFRNETDILFRCEKAWDVRFRVRDEHGKPTTAMFVIRDRQGRIHPSQAKRLAPDFAFHPQVYRADGESVRLPAGEYEVEYGRGPEYHGGVRQLVVKGASSAFEVKLSRWIDPAAQGWWSGDHHIHAAGCAHYSNPTEGVHAPDMMRHCLGEDLKVGCNLTWGPCFDYQKQFFTGKDDKVSKHPYILRYDVEVSGFGSHQSGHLCLLRLKEQMYPGGDSMHHWPKLGLNTLRWAKQQGAVVGPAHSGWGLEVSTAELPNYIVPPFNGIGANEYIMDVTHEVPGPDGRPVPAVDFLSTVDTPYVWELNMWYHTLNVGFRTRISGETDFPCIYGERVGLGRSYVKLDGRLDYESWCEGIRQGRNYVGDGRSHLMGMRAAAAGAANSGWVEMGVGGSELRLAAPGKVRVAAQAAAMLAQKPNPALRNRPYQQKPYWDIERARVDDKREVQVELIVNGYPVERKVLPADGRLEEITFETSIERSSWLALRILPSSHTNPIFVLVDGKPIRASKRSAQWCLDGLEKCWAEKERFYLGAEKEQAAKDYDHARTVYRKILSECAVD